MVNVYEEELEAALTSDSGGIVFREIEKELNEASANLDRIMDAGLPPAEFQKAQALSRSFKTAKTVVDRIWQSCHDS